MQKELNTTSKDLVVSKRIIFLDYLRIFAFISVLVGHKFMAYVVGLINDPTVHSTPRVLAQFLLPVLEGGGAGVVVFFMVSGYIITHVLQTELTGEFLIKRAFRIYPLYIVAVLIQYIPLAIIGRAPIWSTLVAQILLIGDFLSTPYALSGVEWTLRVEIVFYIFMALLRALNFIPRKNSFQYIFIGTVLLFSLIAPIPSSENLSKGYFTIYAPFLLLGSMFYLFEKKQIMFSMFSVFTGLVFYQHYSLMALYQKGWLSYHFAIIAFFIFLCLWLFRKYLIAGPWILLLSDMTYAVYLFHTWFFEYVKKG